MKSTKVLIKDALKTLGIDVQKDKFPLDFSQEEINLIREVRPYTMTSSERIYSLINAVKYVVNNQIEGDIVECGVWRGGSMLAVAKTLVQNQDTSRHLYLFDTFEGMTNPTDKDKDFAGASASKLLQQNKKEDETSIWCYATLESVKQILHSSGYENDKIHFIQGKVEETIPQSAPDKISLLRLDTDWYESTRHELIHLFPKLSVGGVIIIDDYGYWEGARLATDEYIRENNIKLLLNRIDETGRIGIKLP
jgi:O-methyltransferase